MKTNLRRGLGRSLKYLLPLFALLPLQAFGLLWTGGSLVSSNWSDSANWGGTGIAPDDALFFGGTAGLNNTNETVSGTSYSSITFNPGAGSFVLNGNLLNIANGITNDSLVPQTVNLGISFTNNITFDGESDALYILGGLTSSVNQSAYTFVTLAGSGILDNLFTAQGIFFSTNILSIDGNANWTLQDNSYSELMAGQWTIHINSGTFNFGSISSAPQLIAGSSPGPPSDDEVGTVSGTTSVLNVVNGSLTISSLNTATALDSTAIVNQTGGALNIGTYNVGGSFQGANGNNSGEISQLNVTGGALSISHGFGPLYVASCGTGTLTISNGTVKCGTLDISRNANGNSFGSVGTVYLDGGTLTVNNVTNASSNAQTGGNPTATFYFNGGTLAAKFGPSRTFFQGSQVAPFMPIASIVQAGGAIIDINGINGFNAAIAEPLQHDPALGSAQDGGLTKIDGGKLILMGANTYNGNTVISNGTLALSGSASIADSPIIIISATNGGAFPPVSFDVSALSSTFTLGSGQTFSNSASTAVIIGNFNASSGTLSLTYSSGTPSLSLTNSMFSLAPNSVLKINNTGTPLGAGIYTLITTNRFLARLEATAW
jgi:autotransporter-associated beta strand protein